jgi:uncharacterized low-complexity protein
MIKEGQTETSTASLTIETQESAMETETSETTGKEGRCYGGKAAAHGSNRFQAQ